MARVRHAQYTVVIAVIFADFLHTDGPSLALWQHNIIIVIPVYT